MNEVSVNCVSVNLILSSDVEFQRSTYIIITNILPRVEQHKKFPFFEPETETEFYRNIELSM